ncbi:thioredoxin [Plebeiibacterium marinum]|uniref:Thioredoxin n=1 Tax=Plebeiibacterium marinum TaxID=2992111 RepID=A0AAE3MGS1_9BACT|nr:thioredoxin [Plebeiobacterium marinum]MCW3807195.1 thioredoxin [Plebeiobacterium marinum]
MNNFLISTLTALFLLTGFSCSGEVKAKETGTGNNDSGVIYLSKQSFKHHIYDFDANKEWKYEGKIPAILDFYADWCGPCRMLAPVLDDLQKEYKGKLQVFKINTDNEKELAAMFGIRSLPTIVFIPVNGEPKAVMGFRPKEDMEKMISEVLQVTK